MEKITGKFNMRMPEVVPFFVEGEDAKVIYDSLQGLTSGTMGYDEKTHQAAQAVGQAATREDGQAVISAFAKLQNSCLACHQGFRKPFLEHFYDKR